MPDSNNNGLSPTMVLMIVLLGGGVSGTATNLFSKNEVETHVAVSNYEMQKEHRQMKDDIQSIKSRINSLEVFFINHKRGNQ